MKSLRRTAGPLLLPPLLLAALLWCALTPPPARADTGPWTWPLAGAPEVLRGFAPPAQRWLPGHRGADLAADPGAEVLAAGAGRIGFAGSVAGVGVVSVVHGELRTTYLPVEAGPDRGTEVAAGEVIGTLASGPRHCGRRSCLHWGLLRGRDYLDPLSLLGRGRVRLLPVQGTGAGVSAPGRHHLRVGTVTDLPRTANSPPKGTYSR
ncbi:murein DD-endopeptidase MepM/ murein hydrolase activator NlpD [Spinactinospora alkalitolerans]|uniref:Murein DD-endopeptidase MepM/ murein hydrolase activator NlpD n=1 Tax=Spinactinospora alkalitolerans TaxID=687207 RepID=A0A852TVM3_9ACTN|nr:M23 family metallopeptidase [Spinactinospora alkalitolerans]NYE45940.1 murein DD-endopeptidase MepM/ murein hydrolase activator NlpD [Spinactinospora alkalitolerans]